MELSREHKALFALVKAGLWHERIEDGSLFPLIDGEWDYVLDLARRQTVTGLIYRGLDYLHESFLPPDRIMFQLVAEVDQIENVNKKVNEAVLELFGMFEKHGLHPVLQKGQGVATMYLDPLLREPGDIDIYFPNNDEHQMAQEILLELNVNVSKMPDGAVCYKWNGVDVEHHYRMFDIHSPLANSRLKKFFDIIDTKEIEIRTKYASSKVHIPSARENLLLMTSHILKHAIGRGIGLRQMCDLARACHKSHAEVGSEEMRRIYVLAGIDKWSHTLHDFLCEWLGLPEDESPYSGIKKKTDNSELLSIIICGGNFGHYDGRYSVYPDSQWERKMQTFKSFCSHARFSLSVAWQETVWTMLSLVKGQIGG